jgi:hypothetical protein
MLVSVANGDVMPLKGMIVGNSKTKKWTRYIQLKPPRATDEMSAATTICKILV